MTLEILTVDQVKTLLQCSDKTVRARALELGGLKFGTDWVFPAEALHQRLVQMALTNGQAPGTAPAQTPAHTPQATAVLVPAARPGARARRAAPPALPALQLLGSSPHPSR